MFMHLNMVNWLTRNSLYHRMTTGFIWCIESDPTFRARYIIQIRVHTNKIFLKKSSMSSGMYVWYCRHEESG